MCPSQKDVIPPLVDRARARELRELWTRILRAAERMEEESQPEELAEVRLEMETILEEVEARPARQDEEEMVAVLHLLLLRTQEKLRRARLEDERVRALMAWAREKMELVREVKEDRQMGGGDGDSGQ